MEHEGEYLYIIGVGSEEDWKAGRGSLYYIEDRNGEKAFPEFTTPEKFEKYARKNLGSPNAHMDMLESIGASAASAPLTGGRFLFMPFEIGLIARLTVRMEADYLVRDLRPGTEQEIIRVN